MASREDYGMAEEEKLLTVGQAVRGGGPPMDSEEARKLRERVSGSWEKYFRKSPALEEAYGQSECSCCASDDDDA